MTSHRLNSTLLRHLLLGSIAVAAVLLLSTVLDPYRNLQLTNVAYLVCAAAGLSLLTGLSGQISLGQGALMAVGAYLTALMLADGDSGIPLPVVLLAATIGTALVGVLVGAAAARLRGPYLAGATLAFAIGLPALADYRGLAATLGGQNGLVVFSPGPPPGFTDVPFDRWQLAVSTIAAVITLILLANLMHSRFGRSWRALRDDEVAAQLAGLPVARLQVTAFVVSAACAGLGGALLAFATGLAAPGAFGLSLSLQLLAVVVLGGLGTIPGAVYGSFLLVFLPTWSASLATRLDLSRDVYANLPLAIYGAVLVFVMLVFPAGLQGGISRLVNKMR
ncbi:MAG TPA: branched-chain amino acid ABC transporter permease [Kineosporiaceae bacterium]|nr:branched-chain amino acid ABC transporter permease [Kineosporiaceae bacterium]